MIKRLLTEDLDWLYITRVVSRNRVVPLFYKGLASVREAVRNEEVLAYLKDRYLQNVQYNLLLKAELLKILRLFEEHNIAVLPIKGPVLAETVYGNIAFREYSDLDILVSEYDYAKAERVLSKLDFTLNTQIEGESAEVRFQDGHHRNFIHEQNRIHLELHWELIERYRGLILMKDVPRDLMTMIDFGGLQVRTFKPEFLLLYLCVHGYTHQWERLSWLCDVAELIHTQPALDWEAVLQLAKQFHLLNVLAMGLFLVNDILECKIPADVRERLPSNHIIADLARQVEQQIFSVTSTLGIERRATPDYSAFNYALLTSPAQRISFLYKVAVRSIKLTPNERDKEWLHLPQNIAFVYFIVRPVRLIYQYGARYLRTLYRIFTT